MREPVNPAGMEMRPAHYPARAPIDAYGGGGFKFANMAHTGHLLCMPSGIYGWSVDPQRLTLEDFAKVFSETEPVEVMLVGIGAEIRLLPKDIRQAFRDRGISCDVMNTGAAVRTFNVLLSEGRPVAAALIAV